MSNLIIYLKYKLHSAAASAASSGRSVRSMKFWWKVYLLLFIFALVMYVRTENYYYMYMMVFVFVMMLVIDAIKDYRSGSHMHWWRQLHGKN